MNNIKRNMRRVFWLFVLLFALLGGYLIKLYFVDGEAIAANSYNKRINVTNNTIKRGTIYDKDGVVLAESVLGSDGTYSRNYVFGNDFAHVLGYSGRGRSSMELYYNFELETLHWEIIQQTRHVVFGEEMQGNSLTTTLNSGMQELIAENFSGKGAVVALEPSTGKVLAMYSTPGFDPNTIAENWSTLSGDDESSPLLNRAAQGVYPPGSTFKVITAAAALNLNASYADFEYTCTGEATFDGKVIHCNDNKAHGTVNMHQAMAQSCNCYFAALGLEIGAESIAAMAESFGFNQDSGFQLDYKNSSFVLNAESETSEIVETAIGQGKTQATPLTMAMVAAAIANDGVIMQPYVVDSIVDNSGNTLSQNSSTVLGQAVSSSLAAKLEEMMFEVVTSGTGTNAAVSGLQVAGKTGTAQNSSGEAHSWFIGYAEKDGKQVAVAIIFENTGGGSKATLMANKIFSYWAQ